MWCGRGIGLLTSASVQINALWFVTVEMNFIFKGKTWREEKERRGETVKRRRKGKGFLSAPLLWWNAVNGLPGILLGCSQWLPQLLLCSLRSSPSSEPCVGASHSALLLGNERVPLDLVVLLHHLHRAGFLPVLFVGGGVPGLSVQFFPHLFFFFFIVFAFVSPVPISELHPLS